MADRSDQSFSSNIIGECGPNLEYQAYDVQFPRNTSTLKLI